ncbi:hypothetical protein LOD99_4144 [Oopsacas minuta]|uniref:Ig-like domain-containing protein n=1 Tax=Oopsacas minuta TaxID=111878 RepID=A0AAV7JUZ1_9METZ|nr:hypothetical protein LOD99_4144 [Oopsacas minuta]
MAICFYIIYLLLPTVLLQTISVTPSVPVVGGIVMVSCTGNLTSDLFWSFNMIGNGFINLTTIPSYELNTTSTNYTKTLTWTIRFQITNAGWYKCESRMNGTVVSNIQRLATGIRYRNRDRDVEVVEGTAILKIHCRFQSAPPGFLIAEWCFQPYVFPSVNETSCIPLPNNSDIIPISPTENLTSTNTYTSTVRISNVLISNAGIYRCFLSDGFTNLTKGVRVRVRGRLDPLWPAIGIMIQLVIIVIFIAGHYSWDFYKDKQKKIERQKREEQNLVTSKNEIIPEDEQKANELLINVAPN